MTKHAAPRVNFMESFSRSATRWTGSSWAFGIAVAVILLWIACGPIFGYSDTWQLVINTSTTIVTFLMVFLIQRAQNKDAQAVHLKLNELVAAIHGANNRLIDVEDLSEHELDTLHTFYARLAARAKEGHLATTHSLGEADELHERKGKQPKKASH